MSAKRQTEEANEGQYCSIKCDCGKTHGNYLEHYQRLRASCGRIFWALQPQRGGPLKLFLWPGDWRMKAAKESAKEYAYGQ